MDDSRINEFGVTWRKAVRLNIPCDRPTHNNLLTFLLGDTLPFFSDLCKRSARFILEGIHIHHLSVLSLGLAALA